MNVASICIAAGIVCAFGPAAARAESTSASIAASSAAVSSTASVSIAGLSMSSIQSMPGFPVKAYREGHRHGRVVLGYTVNADGTVGDVQVLEANPIHVFPRTARRAVADWRFAPTGASEKRMVEFLFRAD